MRLFVWPAGSSLVVPLVGSLVVLLAVGCGHRPAASPSPVPRRSGSQQSPIAEAPPPRPAPEPPTKATRSTQPPTPWTAEQVPQLESERRKIFYGSPQDSSAKQRGGIVKELEDVHYVVGNEWTLQAFYDDIKDLGGGYVGVGPDQAYLLIGWQKPELAWLVDYDPSVVLVHGMYRAFFLAANGPEQFSAFFEKGNEAHAMAAIDAAYDGSDARVLKGLFRRNRKLFVFRTRKLKRRLKGTNVPTHLTDQATFDFVQAMIRQDRVRPMVTNLNEHAGVRGISAAARELDVPIRVFYVSNAEEYWENYDDQYRVNVESLYTDERSLLLRTRLIWKTNRDYMYIVQSMDNYRSWLANPETTRVRDMLGGRPIAKPDTINYFRVKRSPPKI